VHIRPDLEPILDRMKYLKINENGYPIPWFVEYVHGKPVFGEIDLKKFASAVNLKLCWVCGGKMGVHKTFTLAPMHGLSLNSCEPPSHLECAEWSARNCPFLSDPSAKRREILNAPKKPKLFSFKNITSFICFWKKRPEPIDPAGLKRNPGVTVLWTTKAYKLIPDGNGGVLFYIGDLHNVKWYAKGKVATREQVETSVEEGFMAIQKLAKKEGPEAFNKMKEMSL